MNYTCEHNEHLNKESPLFHTGHLLKENYKVLNDSNAKDVLSKHNEWLKTASNGLLSTSLNPSTFLNNDKIYGSFIYLNDIWAKKFDTRFSYYDELRLSDDQTCLRKFMTRKDYFKYAKIKYDDLEYQIVVIPYKKTKKIHTRHMVYLIPLKTNADLSKVWDNFYTVSEGNIRSYITKLDFNLIDLHIPTVEHIKSNYNLIDLIYDVFRYNISYNIHSSMVVYLNVDGNGGEENGPIMDNTTDESIEIPYVKANVPHISFIYDDDCKRILFITKDG
jgi:serine protease inhibitor